MKKCTAESAQQRVVSQIRCESTGEEKAQVFLRGNMKARTVVGRAEKSLHIVVTLDLS